MQCTKETSNLSPEALLIIEPFYGGSHKQLIDLLIKSIGGEDTPRLITLSAKKWPWRARCSALVLSNLVPTITTERVLFTSSVLNLPELLGLRPDLVELKKVVYFHENQLAYPIRRIKDRDIQFAYNQIVTCLAADVIIFNSYYNKNSFLTSIKSVIKIMPDYRPKELQTLIEPKCHVLYFPIDYSSTIPCSPTSNNFTEILHIVWPHRWEFDKNPETLILTLFKLKSEGYRFRVSIIGETFQDVPDIMSQAKEVLTDEITNFGFVESKDDYFKILRQCHIAVSTAHHEFFGVSMLEATYCGCFPLLPNRLVYPELYPKECLYSTDDELYERMRGYCIDPKLATEHRKELNMDFDKFSASRLLPEYFKLCE